MTRRIQLGGAAVLLGVLLIPGVVYVVFRAPEERPSAEPPRRVNQLSGRVLTESEGRPLEHAFLSIDLLSTDEKPDYSTRTGAEGAFEVKELADGVYRVTVTHEEWIAADAPLELEVRGGKSVDDQVIRLKRGIEIRGRVVRADTRAPVSDVEVAFRWIGRRGTRSTPGTAGARRRPRMGPSRSRDSPRDHTRCSSQREGFSARSSPRSRSALQVSRSFSRSNRATR